VHHEVEKGILVELHVYEIATRVVGVPLDLVEPNGLNESVESRDRVGVI
jgi:hypothetical protein